VAGLLYIVHRYQYQFSITQKSIAMKKTLLIALPLAVTGFLCFYLLNSCGNHDAAATIDKTELTGTWKLEKVTGPKDSADFSLAKLLTANDSEAFRYRYDFNKEGLIQISLPDSVKKDTVYYQWQNEKQLGYKDNEKDSVSDVFTVNVLTKDSMILQTKDSSLMIFSKPQSK
jgi:hypothetical protein